MNRYPIMINGDYIMKKRLIVFIVSVVVMVLTLALVSSAEDTVYSDKWGKLMWELDMTTGELTVTGEGRLNSLTDNTKAWGPYKDKIKKVVIGEGVNGIGAGSFKDCTALTEVVISNTVTYIGDNTFMGCTALTNVSISQSVTSIGVMAFRDCTSLDTIVLPDSITNIGNSAFWGCTSLKNITISKAVADLDNYTFYLCTGLESIVLPDSITRIGNQAFYGCTSLKDITFRSVMEIGNSAFYGCTALGSITLPNSVVSMGEEVFYSCSALESITLSSNLLSIPNRAFKDCSSLKEITIPDSVKSIGELAFDFCSSLERIIIGDGVDSIGDEAFMYCTSLKSVHIYSDFILATITSEDSYGELIKRAVNIVTYKGVKVPAYFTTAFSHSESYFLDGKEFTIHSGHAHVWVTRDCKQGTLCSECGLKIDKILDHSFTNYVSDGNATCTEDGTKTAKCDKCEVNNTITDIGSALGHNWSAASCTLPRTCLRCALTEGASEGHSFTNYVSDGNITCTEDGTKTAKCDKCDVTDTVPDVDSKYGHNWRAPTCTEPSVCVRCLITEGESLGGHIFTNYVSDGNATYTEDGTKTAKCDRCDATNTVPDEGSKLGLAEKFRNECKALHDKMSDEEQFVAYRDLLLLYSSLTEEEKESVSSHYDILKTFIADYNKKAEVVNDSMAEATKLSLSPITVYFGAVSSLWFVLKKLFRL